MNRPPAIMFNPEKYRCFQIMSMSYTEQGKLINKIFKALEQKDFKFLEHFHFIDRIYKGYTGRPHIPKDVKERVLSIGFCQNCGSTKNLTIDHIIPVLFGGKDNEENLQCLCFKCNRKKGPNKNGNSKP